MACHSQDFGISARPLWGRKRGGTRENLRFVEVSNTPGGCVGAVCPASRMEHSKTFLTKEAKGVVLRDRRWGGRTGWSAGSPPNALTRTRQVAGVRPCRTYTSRHSWPWRFVNPHICFRVLPAPQLSTPEPLGLHVIKHLWLREKGLERGGSRPPQPPPPTVVVGRTPLILLGHHP